MARPNYKFKKRQKELKKQKKREEKLLRKHGRKDPSAEAGDAAPEGDPPDTDLPDKESPSRP